MSQPKMQAMPQHEARGVTPIHLNTELFWLFWSYLFFFERFGYIPSWCLVHELHGQIMIDLTIHTSFMLIMADDRKK